MSRRAKIVSTQHESVLFSPKALNNGATLPGMCRWKRPRGQKRRKSPGPLLQIKERITENIQSRLRRPYTPSSPALLRLSHIGSRPGLPFHRGRGVPHFSRAFRESLFSFRQQLQYKLPRFSIGKASVQIIPPVGAFVFFVGIAKIRFKDRPPESFFTKS